MVTKKRIIEKLNRIIPKKNIVLLSSFPAFRDNALSLYQYICDERKDLLSKYRFFWAQEKMPKRVVALYTQNAKYVKKNSLKGLWLFLRAKYVISTHNYFADIHSGHGQIQINLWHGNGYKVIPPKEQVYRGDYTIGTSDLFIPILSQKLGIRENNIWLTGLPRNDDLFHKNNEMRKLTKDRKYSRVILWMPTYRKAMFNHSGIDGNTERFGLDLFLKECLGEYEKFLEENNTLLLIKPHPMDELSKACVDSSEHIVFFTNETLERLHINLYSLLAETDALISDYSSVVIDYLLIDKPIGILCADLKEYENNRGFVLNPVVDYFPGPLITSSNELKQFISLVGTASQEWVDKRKYLKNLFHKYIDDRSSERVCNIIFGCFEEQKG